jgi:hypothetical protein
MRLSMTSESMADWRVKGRGEAGMDLLRPPRGGNCRTCCRPFLTEIGLRRDAPPGILAELTSCQIEENAELIG